MSASIISQNTKSLGLSVIYWMCGSIFALAGTYIYVELGLTIPRFPWKNGVEICTPRNGGELNYVRTFPFVSVPSAHRGVAQPHDEAPRILRDVCFRNFLHHHR